MAKIFRATIFSKGLILVIIPLLFELTFGLTMYGLQSYYRQVIAQESKAKAIIYHCNEMWLNTSDAIVEKIENQIFARAKNSTLEEETNIQNEYQELKTLIGSDHERMRQLKKVKRVAEMLIHTGGEFEGGTQVQSTDESAGGGFAALKGSFSSFQHLQQQMRAFGRLIRQFRRPDELKSVDAEQNVARIQSIIDVVIVFAIAFSVLMNGLLFLYFIKGINKGILNLLENTKRMSRSEPLLPELTSDDEFGHLDRSFHQMAKAVESAKEQERALDAMKKEFFAMISHDMRTPLSSIVTAVECLLAGICGDLSERANQYLHLAEQGAQYLLGLVQDLLDIERLSTGAFPLQKDDFDFADVFKQAADMVSPLAAKSKVSIKTPEGDYQCHGDRDALTRVVVNLVSNAIKFSPPNSSIDISANADAEGVLVEIKDSGRGIPEDAIDDVFDRFKQVEIADMKKKGGVGLGLAICKGFVEAHGGKIGVKSKPGEGSTFWFRIPQAKTLAAAD